MRAVQRFARRESISRKQAEARDHATAVDELIQQRTYVADAAVPRVRR